MTERAYDQRTWEAVQETQKQIAELNDTMIAYISKQEQVCVHERCQVDHIHTAVFGNGKPGLEKNVDYLLQRARVSNRVVGWAVAVFTANVGTLAAIAIRWLKGD